MPSLSKEKSGGWRIQVIGPDEKRRSIRFSGVNKRAAESILCYVGHLEASAKAHTTWDPETAAWVGKLEAPFYKKLVKAMLVPPRAPAPDSKPQEVRLGEFLDSYIASRTDIKQGTLKHLMLVKENLVSHFGADKLLRDITPGDADDFRRALSQGDNTVRRICGRAKQFFRAAVRKRLISENPFGDMKDCNVKANRERDYFVSLEDSYKVLAACPDAEWRLIFALSRFGGLRCPSEHLALTLNDADWENNRLTVHSPKTEHHEGKESRVIPIFPELRPYLAAVYDEAPEGTMYFINRRRASGKNWRTRLKQIVIRAGLKPWPKLTHNLRATRETELAERFPIQVVCEWIGNSQAVAKQHYLQVTDEHYRLAIEGGSKSGSVPAQAAAQNPAQHVSADMSRHQPGNENHYADMHLKPVFADACLCSQINQAATIGDTPFLDRWPASATVAERGLRIESTSNGVHAALGCRGLV
jgi:integrase